MKISPNCIFEKELWKPTKKFKVNKVMVRQSIKDMTNGKAADHRIHCKVLSSRKKIARPPEIKMITGLVNQVTVQVSLTESLKS